MNFNIKDKFIYQLLPHLRKKIHPSLLKKVEERITYEVEELNNKEDIIGPALYLGTHNTSFDSMILNKVIRKHCYILVGKQNLKFSDRLFFFLNGNILVNRDSKKSKKKSTKKMVKYLINGISCMMFPEATWCEDDVSPINHMYWKMIDIAREANVPIVLTVMEYIDKKCYINHVKPIYVNNDKTKEELIQEIEGKAVAARWEIWEKFSTIKSSNYDVEEHAVLVWKLKAEHLKFIEKSRKEYPNYNPEFEQKFILNKSKTQDPREIYSSINHTFEKLEKDIEKQKQSNFSEEVTEISKVR